MTSNAVDYTLSSTDSVSNPDGSVSGTVRGAGIVEGPGSTRMGSYEKALHLGTSGSIRATLSPGAIDPAAFSVRAVVRFTEPVSDRRNIVECTATPFALFAQPATAPNAFDVVAAVDNTTVSWTSASTYDRRPLSLGQWYVLGLVYDGDTLAVTVDGAVVGVTAFPDGGLRAGSGDKLVIGSWVDGARWPLHGDIAAVRITSGLPTGLDAAVDAQRTAPEWFLTHKHNAVRPRLDLGTRTSDLYYDRHVGAWLQPFSKGVISYAPGHGTAHVMYGAIWAGWHADSTLRAALGFPVSDEVASRATGGRKSLFRNGGIYWSAATGAVPVKGRMYLDYELIGEGASAIGLPTQPVQTVTGGQVQQFRAGRMFHRNGASNAFEAHGAILAHFDATGGLGRWGWPVTHEADVLRNTTPVGKLSQFQAATFYWSAATGAHAVYGGIRETYLAHGGPVGDLGFPTSDEEAIPGVPGHARYNTFTGGTITWFDGAVHIARPFEVYFGRVDTKEEDRDAFDLDGQNDLYFRVCVDVDGARVFDRKLPQSGDHYPSANIMDLNYAVPHTVTPNRASTRVVVRLEVWESDNGNVFGGGNDLLGTMTKELTIQNAWGLRDGTNGVYRSSNFGPWVNHVDWSLRPRLLPGAARDNWGVTNRGTPTVDWREYGAAFGDVDPDFEIDFGIIDDGLKALFYETVVKGVAAGGNCFGMALESIYSWKRLSRLAPPLARFTNWSAVEDDFNVKHVYQVGADAIWWFVGQFLTGMTHDPVAVFRASWDAYNRGEDPVICLSQNADFSGAPHCILPIEWRSDTSPWQIVCFDPNNRQSKRTIEIDPAANTFTYSNGRTYSGGAWSGGRLHYMPFTVLNHRQRTPVWDAILLATGGMVLLVGADAVTESLLDASGAQLDGTAVAARSTRDLEGRLVPFRGLHGTGALAGECYLGRRPTGLRLKRPVIDKIDRVAGPVTARSVTREAEGAVSRGDLVRSVRETLVRGRQRGSVVPKLEGLEKLVGAGAADLDAIRHKVRAVRQGKLDYYLKTPLRGVRVEGSVSAREQVEMETDRWEGADNELRVKAQKDKLVTVTAATSLGSREGIQVTVRDVPVKAAEALRVNTAPGLRAVDLVASGAAEVRVEVTRRSGDRDVSRSFPVRLDGGTRVLLPEDGQLEHLRVGRIDDLLAPARDIRDVER